MIENQDILSRNEGTKSINRLKNRYKDILPCKLNSKIYFVGKIFYFR
jgi:hypothetical protein